MVSFSHGTVGRGVVAFLVQPAAGELPDETLFVKPQYNTWIELIYDQREDRIRKYADDIIANGFPPGVLMISVMPPIWLTV